MARSKKTLLAKTHIKVKEESASVEYVKATLSGSEQKMITSREAAELCGVTQGRVRQWVMEDRLAAYRVTPKLSLYKLSDVLKIANEERKVGRPKGS